MAISLSARYDALKRMVGGNREKSAFEWTFGSSAEERMGVTRPGKQIKRILSELNFALQLNAELENRYDSELDAAISLLEKSIRDEGVLTNSACAAAEKLIMPMSPAAKEYALIYAGHAHIDMNWMWGWQETVAAALSTFRTVLNLMKEYPEFTFMQSQASCYQIVEKYDPAMMDEIKARIREGRWEVTAAAWVETDKNMPDTESLLHHVSVTRDYMEKVWGVDPADIKLDFSPDTFGHSAFIPEINRFSNLKYYYHCRGLSEKRVLYRYKAPSGSEILMYREPYWYNSGVNPDNGTGLIEITKLCAGLKTGLIVYGVGNHGGGPTRRDIENVIEMQAWPVFPDIRFGRMVDFFELAEKEVGDKLEVVTHELNAFAAGCYTTQSRIKLGNRRAEVSLNDAEKLCALSSFTAGAEYPADRFETAWQDTLFTHFHDILTGSCVQESREHAMGLFADALAFTQTAHTNALRQISENTDTSAFITDEDIADLQAEGAGVGYGTCAFPGILTAVNGDTVGHGTYAGVPNPERGAGKTRVYTVFNSASSDREENAEVTMWDYTGDLRRLEAVDRDGNALEMAIDAGMPQKYWDHWFVRLHVLVKVPALGYTTICLREKPLEKYETYRLSDERTEEPKGGAVLENAFIRAEFDNETGALISVTDKLSGKEKLCAPAGLCLIDTEHASSSAWNIGRYLGIHPVNHTVKFAPFANSLTQGVEITQKVLSSTVKTTVKLDKNAKELAWHFEIDWNEAANKNDTVPVLVFRAPLAEGSTQVTCDVPAGFITREEKDLDIPCSTFAMAGGLALSCDCKYGYRLADGVLTLTLINSAGNPDPYPERGMHRINMWLASDAVCAISMKRRAEAYCRPMVAMPTRAKSGKLSSEARLLGYESETCVLSGVSLSKNGALKVRVYEGAGREGSVKIKLPFVCAETGSDTAEFSVKPFSIAETEYTKA